MDMYKIVKKYGKTYRKILVCFVPLTARSIVFLEENGMPLLDWRGSD